MYAANLEKVEQADTTWREEKKILNGKVSKKQMKNKYNHMCLES